MFNGLRWCFNCYIVFLVRFSHLKASQSSRSCIVIDLIKASVLCCHDSVCACACVCACVCVRAVCVCMCMHVLVCAHAHMYVLSNQYCIYCIQQNIWRGETFTAENICSSGAFSLNNRLIDQLLLKIQ